MVVHLIQNKCLFKQFQGLFCLLVHVVVKCKALQILKGSFQAQCLLKLDLNICIFEKQLAYSYFSKCWRTQRRF